jgi:hypothetical protein
VIGRAQVDDVDAVGAHELVGGGKRTLGAEALRSVLRPLGARGRDADQLGPRQARGARVDGADEAGGAGDRDAQPVAGRAQDGTPSSAFLASTSIPCRRARFSPRILRLAWSVSGG